MTLNTPYVLGYPVQIDIFSSLNGPAISLSNGILYRSSLSVCWDNYIRLITQICKHSWPQSSLILLLLIPPPADVFTISVQGEELHKSGYNHEIITSESSTPVVASKLIIKTAQEEDFGVYQVTWRKIYTIRCQNKKNTIKSHHSWVYSPLEKLFWIVNKLVQTNLIHFLFRFYF